MSIAQARNPDRLPVDGVEDRPEFRRYHRPPRQERHCLPRQEQTVRVYVGTPVILDVVEHVRPVRPMHGARRATDCGTCSISKRDHPLDMVRIVPIVGVEECHRFIPERKHGKGGKHPRCVAPVIVCKGQFDAAHVQRLDERIWETVRNHELLAGIGLLAHALVAGQQNVVCLFVVGCYDCNLHLTNTISFRLGRIEWTETTDVTISAYLIPWIRTNCPK